MGLLRVPERGLRAEQTLELRTTLTRAEQSKHWGRGAEPQNQITDQRQREAAPPVTKGAVTTRARASRKSRAKMPF